MTSFNSLTGVRPINGLLFKSLIACYLLGSLFALSLYVLDSWSEAQVRRALDIRPTGLTGYELVIDDGEVIKLSSKKYNDLVTFEDCEWLSEDHQDVILERYEMAFEQFPTSVYPELWESDYTLLAIAAFLMLLVILIVPLCIMQLVLLYKSWKSLQPLRQLAPPLASRMPTPAKSVLFLFIPFFNIYWMFAVYRRFEDKGRALAGLLQIPYRGPSKGFAVLFAALYYWNIISNRLDFAAFDTAWYLDMCLSLAGLCLFMAMAVKLWRMINDFAAAPLPAEPQDHAELPVVPREA